MTLFIHRYLHPLSGRLIFWNILLLVFVKLVFPQSTFQLATLIGSIPTFDSREVIRLTNEARSVNQLEPLTANAQLDIAAEEKLNDMALKEYFAHISPSGVTPWFWIQKAQYKYRVAGENLAIGFITPQETVKAWLESPSHKANILNSQYQDIGIAVKGVKIGENAGLLVVQMFGRPSNQVVVTNSQPANQLIPATTPNSSPLISPTVASGQTRGETVLAPIVSARPEIGIQHVSTDTDIPSVVEPERVKLTDSEDLEQFTGILNNTFAVYAFISAIFSIFAFFLYERTRHMALKMSLHAAIFIMAALIPVTGVTVRALIF